MPARIMAGWLPALLALVVLSACEAQLTIDITVAEGGTGELRLELTADEALEAAAAAAGADPLGALTAAGGDLAAEGWVVTERPTADGGRAVTLAAAFDDPADFDALAAAVADALAAPEVRLVERLTLEQDGALLRLEGVVGAVPGPAVADYGLEPDEAVALLAAHEAFALHVRATLPGEIVETTASDNEVPLVWTAAPGERVTVHAVAEQPGPWWRHAAVLAAVALVMLALLTGALALRRRRRRRVRARRGSRWR
jgi:hypothetical protein